MYKNPFLLRLVNLSGSVERIWLFTGRLPKAVEKALESTVNLYNNDKSIVESKVLKDFYGIKWKSLIGISSEARSIGGDGDDLPDDIVGDIFNIEPPESEIAKEEALEAQEQSKMKISKRPSPTAKPKPAESIYESNSHAQVTIVSETIYPEDRVSEVKLKLYAITGVLPMYQHLFYKYRDQTIPLSYVVSLESPLHIDILDKSNTQNILDMPVDPVIYPNKDLLTIKGYDFNTSIGMVFEQTNQYDIKLVNLENYITPKLSQLRELLIADKIQIELLYYGFIVKYFPLITPNVFEQIIKDSDELKTIYPDLMPNKSKTYQAWLLEQEILTKKQELESSKEAGWIAFDKSISVSIKSAILTVEPTDRIQLNLEKILQNIYASDDVPIIKANLYSGRTSRTLTKVHQDPTIQKVYDSVRFRLKLQFPGNILFVLKADPGYLVLVIGSNGRYSVRMSWEDEVTIGFGEMYKIVQTRINEFIQFINNLGRNVFNSSTKLPGIKPGNSKFTDLHINMIWFRSLTESEFKSIESGLQKDFKARCFKPLVQIEQIPNSISFNMYRSMSDGTVPVEELGWNTYLLYSDARIKQRALTFDSGRPVVIIRRATDVKFDLENLTEKEFAYFYDYIKSRLYDLSRNFKTTKQNTTLEPISAKNRLKLLKERDPQLYKFKRFGSNLVYSRICQKQHQPEVYYEGEYNILPSNKKSKAVKYWNFTQNMPMYYMCPNPSYPHLSFLVGKHPSNFCLPCCKKTIVYDSEISTAKKSDIYSACVTTHEYNSSDTSNTSSRYIMTYGKPLDIGRISYLPGLLDKYLRYNLPDEFIEEAGGFVQLEIDGNFGAYSVEQLWKLSKNNKVREIPVEDLKNFLEIKFWNYRLATNPAEIQYSPMEILQNPNLSSAHYNRISNVDISHPILIYRHGESKSIMVDGLHRLARLWQDEKKIAHVRYITKRQLIKSKIDETVLNRKSLAVDSIKKAGYYIYGVPQNTLNVDNVGCLYAVAVALRMTEDEFIKKVIERIKKNKELFNQMLSGNLPRYFTDTIDLIQTLERIGSKNLQLGHFDFNHWNNLFMDFAKYCFGKYCIIFDDRTIDTSGTSVRHSYDDINLILPNTIQDSNELIPNATVTKEYILILRKRKKSKNILTTDHYYYPIFIFIPHEFFKTLNIKKRIFMHTDAITKSIKQLIDDSLIETNRIKYDIQLNTVEQFLTDSKYKIEKLCINSNDKAFIAVIDGIDFPIKASEWRHLNMSTIIGPRPRSLVSVSDLMVLVKSYNAWVTNMSEKAGLIKVIPDDSEWLLDKEKRIVPMYPLIKMEKLLILNKNIIGFHFNGLHYYFKPTPLSSLKDFIKNNRVMVKSPLGLEHIQYDPDIVNQTIWNELEAPSLIIAPHEKLLARASYNKSLYTDMINAIMDYLDDDRNIPMRGKLKKLIISTKDIARIRSAIHELNLSVGDIEHIEPLINDYARTGSRDHLLESIDESIFQFDRISLNKLREISDGYLKASVQEQVKIHANLVKTLKTMAKNIIKIGKPKSDKKITMTSADQAMLLDIFAMDLVNPLRREYLLNGIYSSRALFATIHPGPNEQIFIQNE
jgi:hypothetical protein